MRSMSSLEVSPTRPRMVLVSPSLVWMVMPFSWSQEIRLSSARAAKPGGAPMLRGGAFKPRTSPYAFQGLGETGLVAFL